MLQPEQSKHEQTVTHIYLSLNQKKSSQCECMLWWEPALLAVDEARTPSIFASNFFAMWYLTCTRRDTNSSALDSTSPAQSVRQGQSTGSRSHRYLVCISVPPGFRGENDGEFVSRESAGRVVADAVGKVRKLCQVFAKCSNQLEATPFGCRHTQHSSVMCSYCICASVPCPTSPASVFAPLV